MLSYDPCDTVTIVCRRFAWTAVVSMYGEPVANVALIYWWFNVAVVYVGWLVCLFAGKTFVQDGVS